MSIVMLCILGLCEHSLELSQLGTTQVIIPGTNPSFFAKKVVLKSANRCILGIQCAATKTVVAIASASGEVRRIATLPPVSFSIQRNPAEELCPLLELLKNRDREFQRDFDSVDAIACGVSGLHSPSQRLSMSRALVRFFGNSSPEISIEEDVWFDLASTGLDSGIAVLLSTGVNVFAKNGEDRLSIGGHGSELSDRGGGYYIGRRALMAMLDFVDGRRLISKHFVLTLAEELSIPSPKYVVDWYETTRTTPQWRLATAELAKFVIKMAEEDKDFTAISIVKDSCDEVTRTLLSLFRQLKQRGFWKVETPRFVLCGNIVLNSEMICNEVRSAINSFGYLIGTQGGTASRISIELSRAETVLGCLVVALTLLDRGMPFDKARQKISFDEEFESDLLK